MAIKEKLANIAREAKERAGEAVETSKLRSKVRKEEAAIKALLLSIGELYYDQFTEGRELNEDTVIKCKEIEMHHANIDDFLEQIAAIKE